MSRSHFKIYKHALFSASKQLRWAGARTQERGHWLNSPSGQFFVCVNFERHALRFILNWTQALFSPLSNSVTVNFIQLTSMAIFPFGAGYDTNWPDRNLNYSSRSRWARRGSSGGINVNLRLICTNQEPNANIRAWGKTKGCQTDPVQKAGNSDTDSAV